MTTDDPKAPDSRAGVPPAVAGASRPQFGTVTIRNRGYLPHWEKEAGIYFVTFRLADSLPKSVLDQISSERQSILATAQQLGRSLSPDERKKLECLSTLTIERYLDSGAGSCRLKNPRIAKEVSVPLTHFDRQRYLLFAWCIMPNHVHVLFSVLPGHDRASVIHSWKSYTAKQANRLLHAQGTFWEKEYYDHLVRDQADFDRVIAYIRDNPGNAGLQNWPWLWLCGQDARMTAAEDGGATE